MKISFYDAPLYKCNDFYFLKKGTIVFYENPDKESLFSTYKNRIGICLDVDITFENRPNSIGIIWDDATYQYFWDNEKTVEKIEFTNFVLEDKNVFKILEEIHSIMKINIIVGKDNIEQERKFITVTNDIFLQFEKIKSTLESMRFQFEKIKPVLPLSTVQKEFEDAAKWSKACYNHD